MWCVVTIVIGIIGVVSAHYDDPYKKKCMQDEITISIQGVSGEICSPACNGTAETCPTDVPTGVTVAPQCALHNEQTGDKYCCLVCNPNAADSGDSQCGKDASCKPISTTGICTYDDSPPPPESKHWAVYPSGAFEEMTEAVSLTFFNEKVGWVGGGDNTIGPMIKKTVDGGVTWDVVYPGNESQPKFDIFLSAAAKSLTSVVVGGALFQVFSRDGTYFNASLNDYLTPSQDAEIIKGGIEQKFALIGQSGKCNGVATSLLGNLWKCVDIGVNASIFPVRYGSFPTENTWYVTAGSWPANKKDSRFRSITQKIRVDKNTRKMEFGSRTVTKNDPPFTALISKTTDGGATWTTVFQNTTDYYFNDISCSTADHCVALAEGDCTHIFMTTDGGKTWNDVHYDPDEKSSLMRVAMVSDTEVWATGGHMASLSFQGRFFHSMDGGATWEMEFIKGLYIIDLDMVDATHGFAIGMTLQSGLELVKMKANSTSIQTKLN